MTRIDGIFNRDKYPEHDPEFWETLKIFISALEERMLIGNLKSYGKKPTGFNDEYEVLGLSDGERETLNRLIFWIVCCGLKNRSTVIDILFGNIALNPNMLKKEKEQLLKEIFDGGLIQYMTGRENHQEAGQAIKNLADELNSAQNADADKIVSDSAVTMPQYAMDCFIHGFQYAINMLERMSSEYEPR